METLDIVQAWKQPELRTQRTATHPVGEITLWQAGRLTRRADLLSGHEVLAMTCCPIETSFSAPAITEEDGIW